MRNFLEIDGSSGEGGGQILRTALSLSVLTKTPLRILNIRAGRAKAGLMRQHLVCVEAAAAISAAIVEGAELGATSLCFTPQTLVDGAHHFKIGSAGSAMLVLETVLPALLSAEQSSRITIEGGTHNMLAPSSSFLQRCFLPQLEKMGAKLDLEIEQIGLFPSGGGRIVLQVTPGQLSAINLMERGNLIGFGAEAITARVPFSVTQRELDTVQAHYEKCLIPSFAKANKKLLAADAIDAGRFTGPGNVLSVWAQFEHVSELITAFGARGVSAERVAQSACHELDQYLSNSHAVIGEHLSDQLLLPMYLAGGGEFRCAEISSHLQSNIDTINAFAGTKFVTHSDALGVRVLARLG
jgi:RNA 3'-terminal phosphate cyclase (ATP)